MKAVQGQSPRLVVQFAKLPVLGQVKTRLAERIGQEAALAAHCRLIAHGVDAWRVAPVGTLPWDYELWWSTDPSPPATQFLEGHRQQRVIQEQVQAPGDLGVKMAQALCHGILRGYQSVIIVGSDCASVDGAYIAGGFNALETSDLVLGPAEDGGYVLIGFRAGVQPESLSRALTGVTWGTNQVLQETVINAKAVSLNVQLLDERWDVDEESDWLRFQEEVTKSNLQPV